MRNQSPTSRSRTSFQFSALDGVLAVLSPLLALYLRNVHMFSATEIIPVERYIVVSTICSLIAFSTFRIHSAIPRYLGVTDLMDLAKAVLFGELLTCVVLFTFTRLDGIPRSTPAIHALILGAGLVAVRALLHVSDKNGKSDKPRQRVAKEHAILIGISDLSVLFMKFLEASASGDRKIIGVLDEEPKWSGRSVNGVGVFGPPRHLDALIEEFAVHGVQTDLVLVGVSADRLAPETLTNIRLVSAQHHLDLVFLPDLLQGHNAVRLKDPYEVAPVHSLAAGPVSALAARPYFRVKRVLDAILASILLFGFLPLMVLTASAVLLDVGSPVLFWQQRVGLGGLNFYLYKFRTLRPSFDRKGNKIPEDQRLSRFGAFLRRVRFDELPQLLNVLLGDMSLIGPRPLLTRDQPPDSTTRLMVRPGITGWAQVNGGALLTAAEKEPLDGWYVHNASFLVDLRIVGMTLLSFVRGDRRPEAALAEARQQLAQADETGDVQSQPSAALSHARTIFARPEKVESGITVEPLP